jgi:hypothetical protein
MSIVFKLSRMIVWLGLFSGVTLSQANSQNLQFYCDIKRTHVCNWESCEQIVQPLQPARFRFDLDVAKGQGQFQSCPGGKCGGPYDVTVSQPLGPTGMIMAVLRDETFLFDRELKYFTHTNLLAPNPKGSGTFYAGICSIGR